MNLNKPAVIKKLQERFRNVNAGRGLYTAFLVPTMLTMFSTRAFAADTIWTKASAIMQDVYTQILGISTIAAVVTAAIALLLMNFSRSGRTVDESRAWLKRIIITWAILNKVGYIYISIDSCRGTVGDMDCLVIDSPEELLDKLLYEMAVDIMEEGGHDLNPVEASALERAEVARRLNVYLEQLPEYQDRISFVFERK